MKGRRISSIWLKISIIVIIAIIMVGCASHTKIEKLPKTTPQNLVSNIELMDVKEGKRVIVTGESPLIYTFFRIVPQPLQIVIDIPQTELAQEISTPITVDDEVIKEIVATPKDDHTEISILLTKLVGYHVEKEGNFLYIDIGKKSPLLIKEEAIEIVEDIPTSAKEEIIMEELPSAKSLISVAADTSKKDIVVLKIKADGRIGDYDAFELKKPPRLVIDIWNIRRKFHSKEMSIKSPYLKRVRLGDHPKKVRLVLDVPTKMVPSYRIDRSRDELSIVIGKDVKEDIAVVVKEEKAITPIPKATMKEELVYPISETGEIVGIDFKQLEDKSRIIITTSIKTPYVIEKGSVDTVLIEVKSMMIPQTLIRPLDTHEFYSPIVMITPTNAVVDGKKSARFLVKLRKMVAFADKQENGKIYIDFERPEELRGEKPKPLDVVTIKEPEEFKKEEKPAEIKEPAVIPQAQAPAPEKKPKPTIPPREEETEHVYKGKRISLDFKDADIDNILRLFAEVSNMNIIATEDVKGKVTIRLIDVPWDQALDIILRANNLGIERIGNVVRIAPVERLAKEMKAKVDAAKATVELEPMIGEIIPVNYSKAADLAPKVKDLLTSRGNVAVDERINALIVKDVRASLERAKELVRMLDLQTPQVLIQAKIVEASTSFSRELGISWGGRVSEDFPGQNVQAEASGWTTQDYILDLPANVATGTGGAVEFLIANLDNTKSLRMAISALEDTGQGRVISSPRITTLNHTEASIEQGLRIPYLKYTEEGISTDFIEANLKLTVTPHVTSDGHIKMEIKASKDTPDWSHTVMSVPAIDKREVKTEVLVKDGEVIVIGGVYLYEKSDNINAVPFFYKIPLLGWLFQKKTKEDNKRELLIFIEPNIIQPRRITTS